MYCEIGSSARKIRVFFSRTFIHTFHKNEEYSDNIMTVRLATNSDWDEIKDIYQKGIDTNKSTFEKSPPESYEEWSEKFDHNNLFVHESNSLVNGWISLSKFSSRCCYEGVGEVSIYIDPDAQRTGIGTKLYKHLEHSAKLSGYWTIQAQLFTTNLPSKALFDSLGFREVGIRKNIGMLNGEWVDNFLLEKSISDS